MPAQSPSRTCRRSAAGILRHTDRSLCPATSAQSGCPRLQGQGQGRSISKWWTGFAASLGVADPDRWVQWAATARLPGIVRCRRDNMILGQQAKNALGDELVALRRPVLAGGITRIDVGAVEADKRDAARLQMPDEVGISKLQADEEFGAAGLDEF